MQGAGGVSVFFVLSGPHLAIFLACRAAAQPAQLTVARVAGLCTAVPRVARVHRLLLVCFRGV